MSDTPSDKKFARAAAGDKQDQRAAQYQQAVAADKRGVVDASDKYQGPDRAPTSPSTGLASGLKAQYGDRTGIKGSFKKGGKVRSTGLYRLHKGERVLNRKQARGKRLS